MKKNKIALITGANGFIGSHLSCRLVEEGFEVIGICRTGVSCNPIFNKYVKEKKIKVFKGNIISYDYSTLPKVDYIFHVAGKVSVWGSIESFMKINYEGTKRILDYAIKIKPKCFCQFSSVAVYGFYGYKNLSENGDKKPFRNGYSLSKLAVEDLVKDECKKNNINYVIIRPGNVYGEYDYTSSYEIYSRIKKEKMLIPAGGKYESCFVYVGNLIDATLLTALNSKSQNTDYNVSDGNKETLKDMFVGIAKALDVKPKFKNIPAPLAKLTACLVEFIYKLFKVKKTPLITKFSVWQNCTDYSFSIKKLESIGHRPKINMNEGIKRTAIWFNEVIDKKDEN